LPDVPERLPIGTTPPSIEIRRALEELLPGVIADGVIDAQRISEAVGLPVAGLKDGKERFGLMWAGKRESVLALQTPSNAALLPMIESSIDWDTAKNIFIEGDNLEVLKLLQKSYNDQIKLIYIDPPYNTGNDFVYNDDFSDPARHYLEVTGQVDGEGNRLSANSETTGRKSSKWLSMMYPRIMLARNLLREDGAIFVSIDDNEAAHLREIMDDIFGPENFIGQFVWAAGRKNDAKFISASHEYILVYSRNQQFLKSEIGEWRKKKSGLEEIYMTVESLKKIHKNDFPSITTSLKSWYKNLPDSSPSKAHKHYCCVDKNGIYFPDNISWPGGGGPSYEISHPITGKDVKKPSGGWRITSPDKMLQMINDDRIHFGKDEKTVPCIKRYLSETEKEVPYSVFYVDGRGASKRLTDLLGSQLFEFPKDELVLQEIVEFATSKEGIVLDFFAGSGTTGHSVLLQNAKDGGDRRFILVNIPEPTNENSTAFKAGLKDVAEITRLRLRKVIDLIPGARAQGLRCYAVGASNFISNDISEEDNQLKLEPLTLRDLEDSESVAAEMLLRAGVRLDEAWSRVNIGSSSAILCSKVLTVLAMEIDETILEEALSIKEIHTIIFLEDAFKGRDSIKANAHFSCKQKNLTMKTI
jgi:adenine-specific DNA-methyltransferase